MTQTPGPTPTPTPWRAVHETAEFAPDAVMAGEIYVATMQLHANGSPRANAELICRAVNCHAELVAALRNIIEIGKRDLSNPKYDGYFDAARAALAHAEGQP